MTEGWRVRHCESTGESYTMEETAPMTFEYRPVDAYAAFLERRAQAGSRHGFELVWMPDELFDFQRAIVEWAIRKGRGGIFADCGLGKSPMELVWAENVVRKTNRPVLLLTPLAVGLQMVGEASKFHVDAVRSRDGKHDGSARVVVTNYEQLHRFDHADFGGVVCDESSILKSFDGKIRGLVTDFMRKVPYRLLATATAAPNDYIELGTSSEALGELGHMDMLNRFFKNDQNNSAQKAAYRSTGGGPVKWRFKGHAETPFWRWVCGWARAIRKPSDLGFDDGRFALPPLVENEHVIESTTRAPGMLFAVPATCLKEEREERRRTLRERCERAAELVEHDQSAVVWCHLNDEGDLLEEIIGDSVQVSGSDSDEAKEESYRAFASGEVRVLVTKPKLAAWGLNWQHCAHVVSFASHSFEQYYQSVRRCWRFGQTCPVVVDLVATEGERGIKDNLRRKSEASDRMFGELIAHMNDALSIETVKHETETAVPSWL